MAQVLTTFLNGFEVSGPVTESDFRNYYEGPQFSISFSDEDFEHMIRSVWHVDHAPAKENQQPPRPPALVNEWLVSNYGRRAFDKHFQEWQHAYGMRCLGIPNTKHFHDITLIEDAQTLYSKLKGTLEREQFNAGVDEEYEDSEGHVLNRRTYEDLARQGLL